MSFQTFYMYGLSGNQTTLEPIDISQNIFYVSQMKERQGLEQHECKYMNYPFKEIVEN